MTQPIPCAYRFEGQSDLRVEWRGGDAWCIHNGSACFNRDGEWEYEPMPSSREDDFIARTRYSLTEAIDLATAWINGNR